MKKSFGVISIMLLVALLLSAWLPAAAAPSRTYVNLLNPPKHGVLELEVGESETFYIEVVSEEPFLSAAAKVDQYYPGRGIVPPRGDQAGQGTTALLEITITGKSSTADLPLVCDWPQPGDPCWEEAGIAPVAIVAGMRYAGGVVYADQFPFAVRVP
jgi:hypothetical protein